MAENQCNEMSSPSSSCSSPMIDSNRVNNELKLTNSRNSLNAPKYGTPVPNRVFVGGIPSDANETEVRQLFAQYGNVVSVKIISDRAGIPRGYGFVTYESEEDAKKVIKETDNLVIKNRKLNVSVAIKKQHHYGYEFNPRLLTNGALLYNPFSMNSTNSVYTDIGLYSAEGIPLYQLGVGPQLVGSGATPSAAYPYTYQNSGLYLTTQPSLPTWSPQLQSSAPSSYQYGCGTIRLPIPSQNNATPNMNANQFIHLTNATSPPLSQSSLQMSSSLPVQVATAVTPMANNECAHNMTGAANSTISPLSFINSPVYAISSNISNMSNISNIALSSSPQMACVQNVQLKADNIELSNDNNSLMSTNAISPQMVEILPVWPQRVPNMNCPNKAAINRYHCLSSKSHNNANVTYNSSVSKERRNNSSFNTSQKKLGNNNGNNRFKANNSYGSQNRNSYGSAADNDSFSGGQNQDYYQSSKPNSSALQGQPFVKQYSQKVQTLPINQSVVTSQQSSGPKHTITGQTYIPKVVNGVQIYALANLSSGGDVEGYGSLTPPLNPGSHSNVLKTIHKI